MKVSALFGAAAGIPWQSALAQTGAAQADAPDPKRTVQFSNILASQPPPRVITIPNVGNYKVLKGDFHIHTLMSDGQVMPRHRILEAVSNGLDCISLTEHISVGGVARGVRVGGTLKLAEQGDDHNWAYNLAKAEADKNDLILIRGTEVTMSEWHFNAIFLEDVNPLAASISDWRKALAIATEQGGFVFWNHPSWIDRTPDDDIIGLQRGEPLRFLDEVEEARAKGHIHGVEVFNGISHYPIALDWCNERNLAPITVSDIHISESERYGIQNLRRPMSLILAEDRTESAIREACFAHRIVGWAADMILGKPEWVEKLFVACVDVTASGRSVTIKNKGDIPMNLQVRESKYDLPPQGEVAVSYADDDKLRITNWYVGAFKPLEVAFTSLVGR